MIIATLWGGLGNQMFQYGVARNLAIKNSTSLKLDISVFQNIHASSTNPRSYNLHCFNIQAGIATQEEIEQFSGKKIIEKYEDCGRYNPQVVSSFGNLNLIGCWQTEKYFAEIRNILLREFTLKYAREKINLELSTQIKNCNSISLHVRRGDYISDPANYAKHGVCSLDYYKSCVDYICSRVEHPHFYIFSDDPLWVRENIKIPHDSTFVDHNGNQKNYEDLRLMSECKNNILANSSFSWWGAWLNQNPEKIICAPERWVNDPKLNMSDLIPIEWIKF